MSMLQRNTAWISDSFAAALFMFVALTLAGCATTYPQPRRCIPGHRPSRFSSTFPILARADETVANLTSPAMPIASQPATAAPLEMG